MTTVFYAYYTAKEWVYNMLDYAMDRWEDRHERRASRQAVQHRGADESFADTLHVIAGTMEVPAVSLEKNDITAALQLSHALDVLEKTSIEQFNAGFEAAMDKFLASGEFGPVTDTGQLLMTQMEMSVWVNKQLDQIRGLGAEVTKDCRDTWESWEAEGALQS